MKIKNFALAILLVSIVFSGCNEIKDALDVEFDATFKTDLNIDVTDNGRGINESFIFSDSALVTFDGDATFVEYKDKVREVSIDSIYLTVTSLSPETVNLSNVFVYVNDVEFWSIPSYQIVKGSVYTLGDEKYNDVSGLIDAAEAFEVKVVGYTDTTPVSFTWELSVETVIVANPL